MSNPLVSVVLPVRNGNPYVREAAQSVLRQTYANLELVVLENWSWDGTREVLAGLDDPRLRIVPAERPLSIIENWARAAEQLRGEWMTFLGHDDLFYPDFLGEMIALIRVNPEATVFHSHFDVVDESGNIVAPVDRCHPGSQPTILLSGYFVASSS